MPTVEEVADAMQALVTEVYGKKDLKPMDVTKAMIEKFGEDNCDKKLCKKAIRLLAGEQSESPVALAHLLERLGKLEGNARQAKAASIARTKIETKITFVSTRAKIFDHHSRRHSWGRFIHQVTPPMSR